MRTTVPPRRARRFLPRRCQASRQREVPGSTAGEGREEGERRTMRRGRLVEFQAGVEPDLDEIDEEVERDNEGGVKEDGAADEGVVAVEGGDDKFAAETGDLEDGFDDEGAGDDAGDGGA